VISIETQDADSFVQWVCRVSGKPIIQKTFRQSHYTEEFQAIIPKEFPAIPLYERISGNLILQKNLHLEFLLQFQSKYSEGEKWELLPI
jgi:hypothetical protein